MAGVQETGYPIHGRPQIISVLRHAVAGVERDTHAQGAGRRPAVDEQRELKLQGGGDGEWAVAEDRAEAIADGQFCSF